MAEVKCVNCKNRIGNLCKVLDQRLELLAVEKELEFKKPNECEGATDGKNSEQSA